MSNFTDFEVIFDITEEKHLQFIALSSDHNPMHTKTDYAKKHGFKDKIVHGNILGAFVSYFVGEKLSMKNVVIQKQNIAYHKPFYVGDTLKMNVSLKDYFESVSTYIYKYVFTNQNEIVIAKGSVQIGAL